MPGSPSSVFLLLWVQLQIKDLCVTSIELQNIDSMLNEKINRYQRAHKGSQAAQQGWLSCRVCGRVIKVITTDYF